MSEIRGEPSNYVKEKRTNAHSLKDAMVSEARIVRVPPAVTWALRRNADRVCDSVVEHSRPVRLRERDTKPK